MRRMIAGTAFFLGHITLANMANAGGCYCYGLFTDKSGDGEYYYVSEAFQTDDEGLSFITECQEEVNFKNYIEGRYDKRIYVGINIISGCIPNKSFSATQSDVNSALSRARRENYDDVSSVPFK